MRILSVFFFGVTTMGAHHAVASVTGVMTFCDSNKSSSDFSLSRYAIGMERGVLMQNGFASVVKDIWNSSPSIILICPSNTVGNAPVISFWLGGPFLVAVTRPAPIMPA